MKTTSDELNIFVAVVDAGSFSKAAEQLNLANSVVSRTIKKLEIKLGVTLITRTTRRINFTQEGIWYYEKANNIIRAMIAAETYMQEVKSAPRGPLCIDAANPFVLHVLAPLVREFQISYPEIILTLSSSDAIINLLERRVDAAIRIGELEDSTLKAKKIGLTYRLIVASPKYLKQYGTPTDVSELKHHRCLGFTSPDYLNQWPIQNTEDNKLFEITPVLKASSGETLRQLCIHGNGIACLSDFMSHSDLLSGRLISILEHQVLQISMPIYAVYYGDKELNNRVRCFIDFISTHLKTPHGVMREP